MLNTIRFFVFVILLVPSLLSPQALFAEITITAIDVGQGDAVLVKHEGYAVLIDGGRQMNAVADYLRDDGVSRIHLVIATHAHADHIGGLAGVLYRKKVDAVLYNGQTHTTLTFERFVDAILTSGADYREPKRGETVTFGDMAIVILHPEGSARDYDGHLHDKNIVIRIEYGDFSAIITGDLEQHGELEIIDSGQNVAAQVLELGHHGSRTSSHRRWIGAVNPSFVFWQAGKDNTYGHPHHETHGMLRESGIHGIGTDTHGTIRITANRDGTFHVSTEKGGQEKVHGIHALKGDGSSAGAAYPVSRKDCVDINSACMTELTRIVHIGEGRAKAIVQGRPWGGIDELAGIRGIGSNRLEDIKAQRIICE